MITVNFIPNTIRLARHRRRVKRHVLDLCAERLAFGGLIVLSNNYRRFKLDAEVAERFEVRDIEWIARIVWSARSAEP